MNRSIFLLGASGALASGLIRNGALANQNLRRQEYTAEQLIGHQLPNNTVEPANFKLVRNSSAGTLKLFQGSAVNPCVWGEKRLNSVVIGSGTSSIISVGMNDAPALNTPGRLGLTNFQISVSLIDVRNASYRADVSRIDLPNDPNWQFQIVWRANLAGQFWITSPSPYLKNFRITFLNAHQHKSLLSHLNPNSAVSSNECLVLKAGLFVVGALICVAAWELLAAGYGLALVGVLRAGGIFGAETFAWLADFWGEASACAPDSNVLKSPGASENDNYVGPFTGQGFPNDGPSGTNEVPRRQATIV